MVTLTPRARTIRQDPLTERWVLLCPDRVYPLAHLALPERPPRAGCPFCPGNEAVTTKTLDQIGDPWQARAFPNKFPALALEESERASRVGLSVERGGRGAHEVIVDTPVHPVGRGRLTLEEQTRSLALARRRCADLWGDVRLEQFCWFRNRGSLSGASQDHLHSQLVGLPFVPPENARIAANGARVAALISETRVDGRRVIWEDASGIALCPWAPMVPFEVWWLPTKGPERFKDADVEAAAAALTRIVGLLDDVLATPHHNVVLVDPPRSRASFRWFLKVLPRVVGRAGLEEATGMRAHSVYPEVAASELRAVMT